MKEMIIPKNEIRVSVTSACNMRCVYCHNEGNKTINKLSVEEFERILNSFLRFGLKSVRLTGGEPLVHSEIKNFCKIAKKYGLKVGINTNLIEFDKLCDLVKESLVDRVVVGIDFAKGKISKQSPVGCASGTILDRIVKLKNMGIDVTIATVYNGDIENIEELFCFALNNDIRIKILETVLGTNDEKIHNEYFKMRNFLVQKYHLKLSTSEKYYNQMQGYIGDKRVASFLHSLHYNKECHFCKNLPLRISSNKIPHYCLFSPLENINFDDLNNEIDKFMEKLEER